MDAAGSPRPSKSRRASYRPSTDPRARPSLRGPAASWSAPPAARASSHPARPVGAGGPPAAAATVTRTFAAGSALEDVEPFERSISHLGVDIGHDGCDIDRPTAPDSRLIKSISDDSHYAREIIFHEVSFSYIRDIRWRVLLRRKFALCDNAPARATLR